MQGCRPNNSVGMLLWSLDRLPSQCLPDGLFKLTGEGRNLWT